MLPHYLSLFDRITYFVKRQHPVKGALTLPNLETLSEKKSPLGDLGVLITHQFFFVNFCGFCETYYSYLKLSIGSSLEARMAGKIPEITPTTVHTTKPRIVQFIGNTKLPSK